MNKKGVLLSFLTAGISGVSIFANSVFVSKADPLVFTIIRNSAVVLLLTIGMFLFGHIKKIKNLSRKDWGMLVTIGAVGGGIPFALFFTGLVQTGALSGNIIQKSLFLWVAILAVPLLKERISRFQIIGYLALFTGMFVVSGTSSISMKPGALLILAATILWSVEHVIAKHTLKTLHPSVVSWGRMFFGLPFLFAAAFVSGKTGLLTDPASFPVMPLVASSILLSMYVTTWYTAISLAPVTIVTSVLVCAPIVTAVLSSGILQKPVPANQIISYVVILAGIFMILVEKILPRKHAPSV